MNVTADKSTLKTKLQSLIKAYNDLQFALNEISDPESEEDEVEELCPETSRLLERSVTLCTKQ